MKARRWLLILCAVSGALCLFVILTIFLIQDRQLEGLVVRALQREGYALRAARFGKAFPVGIKARDIEISDQRGLLLKAKTATVSLRLLPLLSGQVVLSYNAAIGNGSATGEYGLRTGQSRLTVSGVHLEELPVIATVTGARMNGALAVAGHLKGKGPSATGELKIEVKDARIAGVKIGGVSLPDADFPKVQGMLRSGGGVIALSSFSLEGAGLFARLKGDLPFLVPLGGAPLNLTLELMPKPDFLEKQKYVFLLLVKYLVSPGNYQIPIRGTFDKPAIQ